MGALLALVGIAVAMIGAPVGLVVEYRRQLLADRVDDGGLPVARVDGAIASVLRAGGHAARHRRALRDAVVRRLVPLWALALALILAGVALA